MLIETEKLPPQNRTGRAEQLLDIDRSGLLALGIAAAGDGLTLNLTDLDLNILRSACLPMKSDAFSGAALPSAIESLVGDAREKVVGIGLTVRGSVDPLRGVSMDSYGLLPRELSLAAPLSARTGLPVTAENNVRGMLTAHSLLCPHSSDGVVLLIKYGPGVGGALMINGKHFLGSRFTACEVGHICAEDGGKACVCSKRGCLETLLRYDALCAEAAEIFSARGTPALYSLCSGSAEKISADNIYAAFAENDEGIRKLLKKPLAAFAVAVASCQAMYDPDCILLCSGVFKYAPLTEHLTREISARTGGDSPRLKFITNPGELGDKSAAATAIKSFLHSGGANFKKSD